MLKKSLIAVAVAGAMTPIVYAQESGASGQLEEVIVTGTRKEGLSPTETLAPVDLVSGTALTQQPSFDLTDSLTKLSPALNTQRFPIADGTAFVRPVTLRNLSPDHTLVLLNGTRRHRSALVNLQLAPLGTVNQGSQGVDFSAFPSAAIERVEILRDGASAQYGSDAIAGVVNVILKDDAEGFSISGMTGQYDAGDGERTTVSANAGFALGSDGFINLTAEYAESDITSRGIPQADAAVIAGIVGADQVPYNGFGQRWGDPDVESTKIFANMGLALDNNVELFGTISFMDKDTLGGFFYRNPVLPGTQNTLVGARGTLKIDGNGDGIADAAPQSLVNSIVADGLDPADYLTADSSSDSGYALLNPINGQFPGGYSPLFGASITDTAVILGAKGEAESLGLRWNVRGRYGENEIEYTLQDSINPSLGRLSPTTFTPGTLTQKETGINLDVVKTFEDSPLNLGFGLEVRRETYEIGQGDAASTAVGPTFVQFGVGSDGFQGFDASSVGSWDSDAVAGYIDAETEITDRLSAAVAVRFESYDLYDDTFNGKLSLRYQVNDAFAIRGTTNTGFRAPSPGQANTLNVTTTSDSSGNLVPNGTYPVNNPVAVALGSKPLENEESTSYTAGIVWTPDDRWSVTVDYYNISIDNRLALASNSVSQSAVDALTAQNYANAALLLGTNANYFVNGFDTEVSGVDIAVATYFDIGAGTLTADWRHNYNKQEIQSVRSGAIGPDRVFDLENQVPQNSSILTFNYGIGGFNSLLRFNYYDEWSTTGGLFGPGDASDATTYSDATLVDLEFSYTLNDTYTFTLGGENIFDEYPDDEVNPIARFVGVNSAVTSPFGFNGAFYYARVSASF